MKQVITKVFPFVSIALGSSVESADRVQANPLGKVLELMDELTAKVKADGEAEAKAYKEYFEWCDEVNTNTKFAIEAATKQKEKLEATIGEATSDIQVAGSKIEELAADISSATAELEKATAIRGKEHEEFVAAETELAAGVGTLGRAIGILEKEMAKNPAMLAQVQASTSLAGMLQSLGAVVDAAAFSTNDRQKLLALVQSQHAADDEDGEFGAPAAANYKSQSGGIVDVLGGMKDKAEGELSELRKVERTNKGNFEMLKASLEAQLAQDNKDLDQTKTGKAAAEETKATAEGDLDHTTKDLNSEQAALANAQGSCMQVAADHGATVAARAEELKVIAKARQILEETASGAVDQTYSLLQMNTHADLVKSEVAVLVKKLAREH